MPKSSSRIAQVSTGIPRVVQPPICRVTSAKLSRSSVTCPVKCAIWRSWACDVGRTQKTQAVDVDDSQLRESETGGASYSQLYMFEPVSRPSGIELPPFHLPSLLGQQAAEHHPLPPQSLPVWRLAGSTRTEHLGLHNEQHPAVAKSQHGRMQARLDWPGNGRQPGCSLWSRSRLAVMLHCSLGCLATRSRRAASRKRGYCFRGAHGR